MIIIFLWVLAAMTALSFVESYAEGRHPWHKRKVGWKIKIGKFVFPGYIFFMWFVAIPLFLLLPFVMYGFSLRLFGVVVSAYFLGLVIEDFMWYVVNPVVKVREFWSNFSNYYPWIKVNGKKIIPLGYVFGVLISVLSWWFLWK